eukprot:CAMPEP_0115871488 /NCGR_PEP_ID=MMETSP0287-20121206/22900_1 /TAXON_ID=412157 /ORGANISM="Chrysochromulina rotalis, Strain UIO044" /LENGTH=36 /DNA_ID= /DNA_START= /DNA_END= /DNA_ORIENTATION=
MRPDAAAACRPREVRAVSVAASCTSISTTSPPCEAL